MAAIMGISKRKEVWEERPGRTTWYRCRFAVLTTRWKGEANEASGLYRIKECSYRCVSRPGELTMYVSTIARSDLRAWCIERRYTTEAIDFDGLGVWTRRRVPTSDIRSAEHAPGVVNVDFGLGLADDFRGCWDFSQIGDTEEAEALAAAQTAVGGGRVQPPAIAATRASGDDVHQITLFPTIICTLGVSL